ncbi:MAG: hypothetical protein JXO22_17200 [Phycisphaerae bacterium]|nr:hypothetical protein [Phycisphaerae bacterium]
MNRTLSAAIMFGLVLLVSGCASGTSRWSHGAAHCGQFFGDAGITGNDNVVTIQRWSRMSKLSITGDNNEITLEDHVRVPLIEVWGSGNTVSIPHDMIVRFNQVGQSNRLVERVMAGLTPPDVQSSEPMSMDEPISVRTVSPPYTATRDEGVTVTPVQPAAPEYEPVPAYEPLDEMPPAEQTPAPSGVIIRDVDPANK